MAILKITFQYYPYKVLEFPKLKKMCSENYIFESHGSHGNIPTLVTFPMMQ